MRSALRAELAPRVSIMGEGTGAATRRLRRLCTGMHSLSRNAEWPCDRNSFDHVVLAG